MRAHSHAEWVRRVVRVGDQLIETDAEGYLRNLDAWSEAFADALAREEGLTLTAAHWEVIHFLRDFWHQRGVQAQVRAMIREFTARWGPERGNNHHLHLMFPSGGPQKQGNRLAGLLKTKGEH